MITRNALVSILLLLAGLVAGYLMARGLNACLEVEVRPKDFTGLTADESRDSVPVRLPLRMVDLGGVGVPPDTAAWGSDYSHNLHYFEEVWMACPPFVDTAAFSREKRKLERYASNMAGYGFNAISFPWFLECVNFDLLEEGYRVYGRESIFRQRHDTLAAKIGQLMDLAAENGLDAYLWTDMVALTPPLESYLRKRPGSFDVEDPGFWEAYRKAAEEVFLKFPGLKGIILRIGEAGSVYNKPGWDYYSELYVRTDDALRRMLEAFLEAAEKHGRDIVFRTWSVGVGEIGDMHTNPETYRRVMDDISSGNLVVSTKYCSGDFYSWLPLNPTMFGGSHRRITEMQAKREFEGFGALPLYVAPLHQAALQTFNEESGDFEGVWVWTQNGGPMRAGPMIIYPFYGFNAINDANAYALGRLSVDPYCNLDTVTDNWIGSTFGSDSLLLDRMRRFLYRSHDVIREGLYISEFAKQDVKALGLELPPMMWIFEWDILSASSSLYSQIYRITRDRFGEVIEEGIEAVQHSVELQDLLLEARERVEKSPGSYDDLIAATAYQVDLFRLLDYYRQYILNFYRWTDTGDGEAETSYKLALGQFRATMDYHRQKYRGNLNTLGLEFTEAETGAVLAERTGSAIRWARITVVLTLFLLLMGIPGFVRDRANRKFAGTLYFDALFRPYRISRLTEYHGTGWVAFLLTVLYILALVVFSGFTSVLFPLAVGLPGLLFPCLLAILTGKGRAFAKIYLSLMAPKMLIAVLIAVVVAVRGPLYFWFQFWTSDLFRMLFLSAYIMLLFRKFHIFAVLGRKWSDRGRSSSAALTGLVLGIQVLVVGTAIHWVGLEQALTALNNELLVLPTGLSKILGITTHLGIPRQVPLWLMITGSGFIGGSLLVLVFNRKRRKPSAVIPSA